MGMGADRAFSPQKIRAWGIQVAIYSVKARFSRRAGNVNCTLIAKQVF